MYNPALEKEMIPRFFRWNIAYLNVVQNLTFIIIIVNNYYF